LILDIEDDLTKIQNVLLKLDPSCVTTSIGSWGILFFYCGALKGQNARNYTDNSEDDCALILKDLIVLWSKNEYAKTFVRKSLERYNIADKYLEFRVAYIALCKMLNSATIENTTLLNVLIKYADSTPNGLQRLFFKAGLLVGNDVNDLEYYGWAILNYAGNLKNDISKLFDDFEPRIPDSYSFIKDTTLHWPCRKGDYILWVRWGLFDEAAKMLDIWEMRNGNLVTLSNRVDDFPAWFEIHPLERLYDYLKDDPQINNYADEVMEGPNIWRIQTGDRLIWLGESRPGFQSINGIISILDFNSCALCVGESNAKSHNSIFDYIGFGSLPPEAQSASDVISKKIKKITRNYQRPRNIDLEWLI